MRRSPLPVLAGVLLCAACDSDDLAPGPPLYDLSGAAPDVASAPRLDLGDMFGSNNDLSLVDKTGPSITFVTPVAGGFVAGIIAVDLDVVDPKGVDEADPSGVDYGRGVKVTLGASQMNPGVDVPMVRVGTTSRFHGIVDTRLLPPEYVIPIVSATAADLEGNHAEVAISVIVDNVGPALDLDPPENLHVVLVTQAKTTCSHPFDPVGSWAVDDGERIEQLSVFRARVEDRGNVAPGQTLVYASRLRPDSVKLYIAPTSYGPLVKDRDGDSEAICDDINPDLVPVANGMGMKATEVGLAPIPATGSANFLPDMAGDPICTSLNLPLGDKDQMMPPPLVCFNDLTIHLSYTSIGALEPSIWSIPSIKAPPSPQCEGLQFDAANSSLPEGPLCAAVVGVDNAGNRNVSRPLRICYDKGGGKCDDYGPGVDTSKLPTCSDGCKPGVRLNVKDANGKAIQAPFPSPYVVYFM